MNVVDIISAIEFDKTGEHLATGDRGGRVVLFERTDGREVCSVRSPSLHTYVIFLGTVSYESRAVLFCSSWSFISGF